MKKSELFAALEPPPGGLTRLRARLSERRASAWRPVLVVASALAFVVAGTLTTRMPQPPVDLFPAVLGDPGASVAMGLDLPQAEPVAITGGAAGLLRLQSGNPQVVMYRLATLEEAPAGEEAPQD